MYYLTTTTCISSRICNGSRDLQRYFRTRSWDCRRQFIDRHQNQQHTHQQQRSISYTSSYRGPFKYASPTTTKRRQGGVYCEGLAVSVPSLQLLLYRNFGIKQLSTTTMPKRGKRSNPTNSSTTMNTSSTTTTEGAFSKTYTDTKTGLVIIEEGSCSMAIEAEYMNAVFYNPVQVQNRDLSILMLQLYGERRQRALEMQAQQFQMKRQELIAKAQLLEKQQQEEEQEQQSNVPSASDTNDTSKSTNLSSPTTEDDVPVASTTAVTNNVNTDDADDGTLSDEVPKVKLQVLDALAASGLRSMRYWKECQEFVSHITINDIDPVAKERAVRSMERNGLSDVFIPDDQPHGRPYGIRITTDDATNVLYNSRMKRQKRPYLLPPTHYNPLVDRVVEEISPETESRQNWDVIDLDPYGSAISFMDAAVQSIAHGGLLNITCTDMRTLSGSQTSEIAYSRYGSLPMKKATYFVEFAIRMVLHSLATAAGRYGRSIKPILSVSMDFYIRVFVEVYDDKNLVRTLSINSGMVYQSTQCPSFFTLPAGRRAGDKQDIYQPNRIPTGVCSETGAPLKVAGPIWLGPLHDQEVLQTALQRLTDAPTSVGKKNTNEPPDAPATAMNLAHIATRERLRGLLTSCIEEVPDAPLYYNLSEISKCIHMSTVPIVEFKSALINAGYRVSGFHKEPCAVKTDAPPAVIWDIIRAWVIRRPLGKPPLAGSAAEKILSVAPSIEVNFSHPYAIHETKEAHSKVVRFPMNPERNWGPKPKASHGKKRRKSDDDP